MPARKYLNETGLASLWAKIVNKINALGDLCVKKAGDIMTGDLTIAGHDLILGTKSSLSDNSGDIVWRYGSGDEKARIWTDNKPETAADGRPNFRAYKSDGTQLLSDKLATASDVNGKLSKSGDEASGLMTFAQGIQIQAGRQGTNPPFFLCLLNPFAQGGDVGWTNTSDMATVIGLSNTIKNKTVTDASSLHNLPGYSADNIPTTKYMAYWNGAYNSSGYSNLKYTSVGELKSAANKDAINNTNCTSVNYGIDRNLAYSVSGAAITCSHSRTKHEGWTTKFTLICPRNSNAIGTLICNTGSSWSHFYIVCAGSPASWNNTYNSGISNMGSTYPTLAVTNTTIDGVAYSVATWTSRAGNMTWHAEYTISNIAAP